MRSSSFLFKPICFWWSFSFSILKAFFLFYQPKIIITNTLTNNLASGLPEWADEGGKKLFVWHSITHIVRNTYKFLGDDTLCFINRESHVPRTIITCREREWEWSEGIARKKKYSGAATRKAIILWIWFHTDKKMNNNNNNREHFYAIANATYTSWNHNRPINSQMYKKLATQNTAGCDANDPKTHTRFTLFSLEKRQRRRRDGREKTHTHGSKTLRSRS